MTAPGAVTDLPARPAWVPRWVGKAVGSPLLAVAATAGVLSFSRLGRESLWFDEAWSIELAGRPLSVTIGEFLSTNQEGPPLYYLLLYLWMELFGHGEAAARSLSAIAAIGAVMAQFLLFHQLATQRVAVIAALLLATSQVTVHFAQEARNYSLLLLLFLLSLYAFVRFLEQPTWRRAAVVGAANLLALLTHVLAVELLIVQGLVILSVSRRNWRRFLRWLTPQSLTLIAIVPMFLLPATLNSAGEAARWVPAPNANALLNVAGLLTGASFLENPFDARKRGLFFETPDMVLLFCLALLSALVGILVLISRRQNDRGEPWRTRIVLILGMVVVPIVFPLAVSLLALPLFLPRYLILAIPAFAGLIAMGIERALDKPALGTVLLVLLLGLNVKASGMLLKLQNKDNWRGAASFVANSVRPGDAVVVSDGRGIVPFNYYYEGIVTAQPVPGTFGYQETDQAMTAFVDSIAGGSRQLWLVMPWRGGGTRRVGLWSFLDAHRSRYSRQGPWHYPGAWGGILIFRYQIRDGAAGGR